jgi:pyruvate dehydrogenase E1 component alpha subunit
MNMAATWKLPLIYCLINNQYAISTHYTESHPQKQLATWADGYEVPNETVDGNDVEAVYEAVQRAAERARAGGGPTLLELMTYRWQGHFSGDPAAYRSDEEVAAWKARCPLVLCRKILLEERGVPVEELVALEKAADAEIAECVRFSLESPWPDLKSATTHVYADLEVEGWK